MSQTFQQPGSKMTEEEIKQALDAISKKENGSKVLEILNVISYFAPENIHTKMFLSILSNEEELGAAIILLKQYSIVDSDREGAVLSVNRSVQKIIRTNLQKQNKEENIMKKALKVLFENRINSNSVDHCISVWSYVSRLVENGINSNNIDHCLFVWCYRELIEVSGELPSYIVNELRKSVRYKEANIFGWKAFNLLKRLLGERHPTTLHLQRHIGMLLNFEGKYKEALEILQSVFKKDVAVLGENHIETLHTRNCIASVLLNQCKYDKALEIYEVVAKQYEKSLGEMHPQTLIAQANLALSFDAEGEHQKALEIFKDVYKKLNETLGPEHNGTLQVKGGIGFILTKEEKYDEALMIFEEVFKGLNKIFGPKHPDTVKIKNVIGFLTIMSLDTIHAIARQGNLSKMRSLVQNGADINKKHVGNGNTPLHYAVQYGHVSVIRLLLESGAIFNIKNKESKIPFQLAKNSIVKAGNHKQVAELVKEKTIVNAKEGGGSTSLHWAAYNGHSSIVKLLLESGADATQVTNKGNTPLHTASSQGYKDIVDILLQHARHNKLNNFIDAKTTVSGATSLHVAVKNGSLDVTKSLLKRGAKYNIKNNEGKTPLDLSKDQNVNDLLKLVEELFTDAKSGNVEIINKLKALKPDEFIAVTNAHSNAGNTFLQVAIAEANKHKNIVSKLLEMLRKSD